MNTRAVKRAGAVTAGIAVMLPALPVGGQWVVPVTDAEGAE